MRARWRLWHKSVIVRMALLVFALLFLAMAASAIISEQILWNQYAEIRQTPVRALRDTLAAVYRAGGMAELAKVVDERERDDITFDRVILVVSRDGKRIAGNLSRWPNDVPQNSGWYQRKVTLRNGMNEDTVILTGMALGNEGFLLTGIAAISDDDLVSVRKRAILYAALSAIPFALVFAIVSIAVLNRRIAHVASTTRLIATEGFAHRLKINGSGDGFDRLNNLLNEGLDHTEMIVEELRLINQSLAHDLKSPLSRLKVSVERAKNQVVENSAIESLENVSAEADQLMSILTTLLQMSDAKANFEPNRLTETKIDDLLEDVAEIYGPLADENGIVLRVTSPLGLTALLNRQLMILALSNLVENALKYADGGNAIVLSATESREGICIGVADNGIGIPDDRIAEARRRFGRLDSARTKPGVGLGLSLVEMTARLHGGRVSYEDNGPGLRVVMKFSLETA